MLFCFVDENLNPREDKHVWSHIVKVLATEFNSKSVIDQKLSN